MTSFFVCILVILISAALGLSIAWLACNSVGLTNRRKLIVNDEDELEKMYKLKSYFEELQFKRTGIHDRVLKELDWEIKMLESTIFQDLGKVVYDKKKGR